MATIRSLYVALQAQTSQYNKAMKDAAQLGRDFGKVFKPTQEAAKQMGTALVAVGGAVGVSLLAMAKKAANYGDEMLEASQKTGIGTKQLAALRLVAEQSGSSFEGIISGTTKLSKSLFEAATKGGDAAKTFTALGISFKDSTGHARNASDLLPEIADRFAAMKDGTEKTAIAMRLFGKAGADIIPVLNQGSEGFRRATEMIEKYNLETADGGKLGDVYNDRLKETGIAIQGLANQIGAALLPGMIKLVEMGNNVIAMVSGWAKAHPGLTQAIGVTAAVLTGSGGLLIGMSLFLKYAPAMIGNIKLLSTAFLGLSVPARIAVVALTALTAAFIAFPKIRGPIIEVLAFINQAVFTTADSFGRLAAVVVRLAQGEFTQAARIWQNMGADMAASWEKRGKMVRDAAAGIGASIKEMNAALKMGPAEMPDIRGLSIDLDELGKDAKGATSQLEQMWKSLRRESQEIEDLEAVLRRAHAAQISLEDITDKFGTTIKDVAGEILRMNSGAMPEYIGKQFALIKQQEAYNETLKEWQEITQRTMDLYRAEGELLAQRSEIDIVRSTQDESAARIEAAEAVGRHRLQLKNATIDLQAQQQQLADTAAAMVELRDAGYSTAQIEAMVGMRMGDVTKRAKELGVNLDGVTRKTIEQAARTDDLRVSWGDTMGSMVDQLVDFGLESGRTWDKLAAIGKSTFKDLARSFLDGLVKPLKDGLRDLGEHAATALGNILFGGKGGSQQGQGILGGIIGSGSGGILGGIFGGGNAQTGGTPPFIGPGGIVAQMNPLMMGASIANQAWDLGKKITETIGKGRDSANEIVKSQNAFVNQTIGGILNDPDLSPTNKLKQVKNAWESMQANLARFSAAGGEGGVTANQAFATLSPWISKVVSDLMKAGASDASGDGAGTTINYNGDVVLNFSLQGVDSPEKWIEWFRLNKEGIREEVARGVLLTSPAIVSR